MTRKGETINEQILIDPTLNSYLLQETSKKSVLKAIAAQDMLQDETESKTGLDEMADKKKLGLAGGLP